MLIDKDALMDLIRMEGLKFRKKDRKKYVNLQESLDIMECSESTFRNLFKDPECLIKKGRVNGRYQMESLYLEKERRG